MMMTDCTQRRDCSRLASSMRLMQRVNAGRYTAFQPASSASRVVCMRRPLSARRAVVVRAAVDNVGAAAIAAGLVANPIVLWSAYTLKTTGSGLPPGPGGALGAAEGVSYLVILGIVGWSVYTKSTTGSGLPAGPSGLLGAVEGFSYLGLLAAIAAFGANAAGL